MANDLVSAALRYAELGYPVFPCVPGGKRPLVARGFHEATTDPEQIERWWKEHPQANIGLPTAGLVVLDLDGRNNPWPTDTDQAADLASAGAVAVTPRGGRHLLFRRPEGKAWKCSTGKLAPGVDIRTDGGYIVVPPSRTDRGDYLWVEGLELDRPRDRLPEPPAWLVQALDRLGGPGTSYAPSANGCLSSAAHAAGGSEASPIPQGQRNSTLARLAGAMRRVGMSQAEITAALVQINRDRCLPPLHIREVERIAASIARYEPDAISVALVENHFAQMDAEEAAAQTGPSDPGPFPDHLLAVPGFVGEVMAYTLATAFRPQPVLALGAALALLGTLTGRKVRDDLNTRTNVYCLGVCPSGGGKERTRQVNKEILFLAGAAELAGPEGLASHAGLVSAVEQQPAILFQLDEIGRLLRTLAEPGRSPHLYHIVTNLMKLFTSSGSVYIGDAYADPKRNKVIHQPHACLWGTTVPWSFYEGLTAENVSDGFLSRVMIFETPAELPAKQRPQVQPVPDSIVQAARRWLDFHPSGNLHDEHPVPRVVPADASAQACFETLDRDAERGQVEVGEPLGTLWTRATEKARKLALLYACSRGGGEPVIDEAAARWGCAVSAYLTRRLIYLASQWVAENPFDAKRKRVLRLIVAAGEQGLSRSELYARTRAFTTRERAEVLDALLLCGDVREVHSPTGRRGAPGVRYVATTF
ncbi:MAG: bifunctional DNA primase/polymerase [Gemmataceae bacterium]|nr:bifunctional DNA primase/polymerase [Gemmataceae bacterium]